MQGCHVTVISTSEGKRAEALGTLGADAFINSKDPEAIKVCVCVCVGVGGAGVNSRDPEAIKMCVCVGGEVNSRDPEAIKMCVCGGGGSTAETRRPSRCVCVHGGWVGPCSKPFT